MSYNPTFYRGDEMSMSLTSPMFARNMPKELEVNSFVKAVDPLDDAFVPRTLDDFYALIPRSVVDTLGTKSDDQHILELTKKADRKFQVDMDDVRSLDAEIADSKSKKLNLQAKITRLDEELTCCKHSLLRGAIGPSTKTISIQGYL